MNLCHGLKTSVLPKIPTSTFFKKNLQLRTVALCIPLIDGDLKIWLFNYYSKKNLTAIVKSMCPPIFEPLPLTSYHI